MPHNSWHQFHEQHLIVFQTLCSSTIFLEVDSTVLHPLSCTCNISWFFFSARHSHAGENTRLHSTHDYRNGFPTQQALSRQNLSAVCLLGSVPCTRSSCRCVLRPSVSLSSFSEPWPLPKQSALQSTAFVYDLDPQQTTALVCVLEAYLCLAIPVIPPSVILPYLLLH